MGISSMRGMWRRHIEIEKDWIGGKGREDGFRSDAGKMREPDCPSTRKTDTVWSMAINDCWVAAPPSALRF